MSGEMILPTVKRATEVKTAPRTSSYPACTTARTSAIRGTDLPTSSTPGRRIASRSASLGRRSSPRLTPRRRRHVPLASARAREFPPTRARVRVVVSVDRSRPRRGARRRHRVDDGAFHVADRRAGHRSGRPRAPRARRSPTRERCGRRRRASVGGARGDAGRRRVRALGRELGEGRGAGRRRRARAMGTGKRGRGGDARDDRGCVETTVGAAGVTAGADALGRGPDEPDDPSGCCCGNTAEVATTCCATAVVACTVVVVAGVVGAAPTS